MELKAIQFLDEVLKAYAVCREGYQDDTIKEAEIVDMWEGICINGMRLCDEEVSKVVRATWSALHAEILRINAVRRGDHFKSHYELFRDEQERIFIAECEDGLLPLLGNQDYNSSSVLYYGLMMNLGDPTRPH